MFKKRPKKHHGPDLLSVYHKLEHKVEDVIEDIPRVKEKRKKDRFFRAFKILFYCFLGGMVIIVLLGIFVFKDVWHVYQHSISGKKSLERSIDLAYVQDFEGTAISASKASNDLAAAHRGVDRLSGNFLISNFDIAKEKSGKIQRFLRSATLVVKSLEDGGEIGARLKSFFPEEEEINFEDLSEGTKKEFLRVVYESPPALRGIEGNLKLALADMENINEDGFFFLFDDKLEKSEKELGRAIQAVKRSSQLAEIIPLLAGYPQRSDFLLMLQNNDELRPSGGFLGTYGIAQTENGIFKRLETHDIYHMDMPVKDKIEVEPPRPIKKYLNNEWFMRDSNWSPDWPTSAQKIEWFYHLENELLPPENQINDFSGEFEGVIGITPVFVTDLLAITGPIVIEGTEYNKDNFTRLLQYRVEEGYVQLGVPSWERKEVIGKILQELKIRLLDLPASRWGEVVDVLQRRTGKKDALIYFKDNSAQEVARDLEIAGEMAETDKDYLMVADANLGSLKTDAVIKRNINYSIRRRNKASEVELSINYSHTGGIDWRTTHYKTYTRVYVPKGSKLISLDKENTTEEENKTQISDERGKTVFGTYLKIPAGSNGSLNLKYRLPEKISQQIEKGGYELYWQKQPGNSIEKITVDADLGSGVKSYNPTGFYADKISNHQVRWSGELREDRGFKIEFAN
ncbi:MAG: DUF4012 domain-containing protein [Patescibacteria group bacterium]